MKRALVIFILSVLSVSVFAQMPNPSDTLFSSRVTRLLCNGRKMSDADVRSLLLSSYGDGEKKFEAYLQAQDKFGLGLVCAGGGLAVAGFFTWLQVLAFRNASENGGCVSPGGFPFILGGLICSGVGIVQSAYSVQSIKKLAKGLNGDMSKTVVSPAVVPGGVGVIMNF